MRLYKLLSRTGQRKQRPYPWFEAPAAGAPQRYVGWTWDPSAKEWVRDVVVPIKVEVMVPKFPRPISVPRSAQPINVPGWYWNGRAGIWEEIPLSIIEMSEGFERGSMPAYPPGPAVGIDQPGWSWFEAENEWVATSLTGRPLEFLPPPTLPPDVENVEILLAGHMGDLNIRMIRWAVSYGMSYRDAVGFAGRAMEDFAGWGKAMTPMVYKALWAKYSVGLWDKIGSYTSSKPFLPVKVPIEERYAQEAVVSEAFVTGVLVLVAAAIGYMIGTILDRLITPAEDYFVLSESKGTYLVGPDDWKYSKYIGLSPDKRLYFSECQDIGTDYTRHKRGWGTAAVDTIDFPGGFIESGYQFPYWIKYTWQTWSIEYVGMLESVGQNLYRLKVGRGFTGKIEGRGRVLPSAKWCSGFHYYL